MFKSFHPACFFAYALIVAGAVMLAFPVVAQDSSESITDLMPAKSISITQDQGETDLNAVTHPPLRLTPDKSELVRLDADVTSVIIGNPAHLSVLADSSRRLVVVPKVPGASFFSAIDGAGNVVMQRHVIVGAATEKYLRVRKTCARTEDKSCQNTQVYYCPDMCHEIAPTPENAKSAQIDGDDNSDIIPDAAYGSAADDGGQDAAP